MKTITDIIVLLCLFGTCTLKAQIITLKSGDVINADSVTRQGNMLMVTVNQGELGYAVNLIDSIQFKEPSQFPQAFGFLDKRHYESSLILANEAMQLQEPYKDIPGNLWVRATLLRVEALIGEKRLTEAAASLQLASSMPLTPELQNEVKLDGVLLKTYPQPSVEIAQLNEVVKVSKSPRLCSRSLLVSGDLYMNQNDYEDALLSYLTVSVFYADNNGLVPDALYGCGLCYERMKDLDRAKEMFEKLLSGFKSAPDQKLAEGEIVKINKMKERENSQ